MQAEMFEGRYYNLRRDSLRERKIQLEVLIGLKNKGFSNVKDKKIQLVID